MKYPRGKTDAKGNFTRTPLVFAIFRNLFSQIIDLFFSSSTSLIQHQIMVLLKKGLLYLIECNVMRRI